MIRLILTGIFIFTVSMAAHAVPPTPPNQYIQLLSPLADPDYPVSYSVIVPGKTSTTPGEGKATVNRNIGLYTSIENYAAGEKSLSNCRVTIVETEDVTCNPGKGAANSLRQVQLQKIIDSGSISCDRLGPVDLTGATIGEAP